MTQRVYVRSKNILVLIVGPFMALTGAIPISLVESKKCKERITLPGSFLFFLCACKEIRICLYYPAIRDGTFSGMITDFFLPLRNLSYISSRHNVGTNPRMTHEIDSIISILLVGRFY